MTATASVQTRPSAAQALILSILVAGLVAGTIDIFAASTISHARPAIIMRFIASGLFGPQTLKGPDYFVAVGLVTQWGLAWIIAAIFLVARTRLPVLAKRPVLMGALYGVPVYVVMTFVVLPLSAAPKGHASHPPLWYAENLAAMVLFGLIVALTPMALERLGKRP
jgi:hypothetical protein